MENLLPVSLFIAIALLGWSGWTQVTESWRKQARAKYNECRNRFQYLQEEATLAKARGAFLDKEKHSRASEAVSLGMKFPAILEGYRNKLARIDVQLAGPRSDVREALLSLELLVPAIESVYGANQELDKIVLQLAIKV